MSNSFLDCLSISPILSSSDNITPVPPAINPIDEIVGKKFVVTLKANSRIWSGIPNKV